MQCLVVETVCVENVIGKSDDFSEQFVVGSVTQFPERRQIRSSNSRQVMLRKRLLFGQKCEGHSELDNRSQCDSFFKFALPRTDLQCRVTG